MKSFTLLALKQFATFIIMICVLVSVIFTGFGSIIEHKHKNVSSAVNQFLTSNLVSESKLLSRQLKNGLDVEKLVIQKMDSTNLYSFKEKNNHVALAGLFEQIGLTSKTSTITNKDNDLKVTFKASHYEEYKVLQQLLIAAIIIPLAAALLSIILLKGSVNRIYRKTSETITDVIHNYVRKNDNQANPDWSKLPDEFSDTISALSALSSHVDKQSNELKQSAEKIMDEAYKDTVTGLANRNRFVQYFDEKRLNEKSNEFGVLAIIRCSELMKINHAKGYQEGDKYVIDVAEIISAVAGTYSNSRIFRLNGSDFGVVIPNIAPKESERFAQNLQSKFNEYQKFSEIDSVAYTGLVAYDVSKPLGEMLALADTAISLAQSSQMNGWFIQKESSVLENVSASYGNQNWRQVIDDVLTNTRVSLLHQPIQPTSRSSKAYSEVLARFKTAEGQILPTASFLSMAEKLDKIVDVDKVIIEKCLDQIKAKNLTDQYFGINITPKTAQNEQFMIWLERRLLKDANIANKLIFEVTEYGLQQNIQASKRFIDMIHRVGARITVERFGVGMTSFKFFRDLKPDFIKMDGSYTRDIDEDKNNQYFMRLMVDLAHRIGVTVFAECVETQEEKHVLEQLLIDGTQGYFIGKPSAL
ncbi:EAL domain-containing protein [Flocculibacter collagenilyticus]|uniref:EAL domain-containing protein n=1 Tax=Flocculibacter collagenilyticus TaxID=2744479 RepID=UPI0018F4DBB2|nr:GGDEF domain-containing protein [Flocculibacter collagenilyticus]